MLELDGLTKRYGDTVALDGLTFDVAPGQMFGFVGRNGAGKTTTMRIVLGVLAADAGEVRWQGRLVDAALRSRIGYMPEERGLYPKMRVGDHLAYLAQLHGVPAAQVTRAVDLWLDALGIADRRSDRVEALSLGNQQRVQLAAALVHEPDILVLDEPFSGLDPVGVDVLAAALQRRVDAGVPVVFSSHQLDLVERLCDAVGIVDHGRMVAAGTVAALRGNGRARRFRIRVEPMPAASPGPSSVPMWWSSLPGVTQVGGGHGTVLLELAPGVDDQALLGAATRGGVLREFTPLVPSLSDLFRETVTA